MKPSPIATLSVRDARREIARLTAQILRNDRLYYQQDNPQISDAAYDALRRRLQAIEQRFPRLRRADSPSFRVGAAPRPGLAKIHYDEPVLSLDNVISETGFAEFIARARRRLGLGSHEPIDLVAEPKIDGLTAVCRYEAGRFVRGGTRGDGRIGEDVTTNLRRVRGLPPRLRGGRIPRVIEVRGEVYLSGADFRLLNAESKRRGGTPFSSPRNAAAGSLRHLDSRETDRRRLRFFVHGWGKVQPPFAGTYAQTLRRLKTMALTPNPLARRCRADTAQAIYEHFQRRRHRLAYDIDGVVFKINRLDWQSRLGATPHAPRWAIAYKFPGTEGQTLLKRIVIQVGRTGVLTPVALMAPITLEGAVITRATLHNEDYICRNDIRQGDTVLVRRAGAVIPQVISPVAALRPAYSHRFSFPRRCPECGSAAVRAPGEAACRCIGGLICPAQRIGRIRHFASRDAADIEGLGPKRIAQLSAAGLLNAPADLYRLFRGTADRSALMLLPGWNHRSVERLVGAVERSRQIGLDRFIYALGIPAVGLITARKIARLYRSAEAWIRDMRNLKDHRAHRIESIGHEITEALTLFFSERNNRAQIAQLLSLLSVRSVAAAAAAGPLAGKSVAFTGTLSSLTRAQARRRALQLGASVTDTISRRTDFVVAGKKPGEKLRRARALGVAVLPEEQWSALSRS